MTKKWQIGLVLFLVLFIGWGASPVLSSQLEQTDAAVEKQKVRAYFPSLELARQALKSFETLESEYETGYLVMALTQDEIDVLTNMGFDIEVIGAYDKSAGQAGAVTALETQLAGIPGYTCYRTVEETFATAQAIANDNPTLASWIDAGNSWEKTQGLGGYDMMVLKLSNSNISGPKPKLFVTAAIHAREYATAELVTQFAEYLVNNYGTDADATWILDHHEIHLMLHTNPDGRKKAEAGSLWRKNTNQNYCGATSSNRGADLNRNFEFSWGCCGGSSGSQCNETYRGPSAASEPETQAVQNYVRSQFVDNRGPNQNDPAPDDTSGIYLDIHSHGRLVLWPWGHTSAVAPNGTQLQTLGRKFAYWNNHSPEQSIGLYPTDGTTDGVGYGELGVPSFTFELGTAFFQSCSYFTNTIVPDNMPSLIYAAKTVRTPYMTPAGPDAYDLTLTPGSGSTMNLTATINDQRYNNSNGTEPTQNISGAEYYIDVPSWDGGMAYSMSASDGSFNSKSEGVTATIDTSGLSGGDHIIFVRGQDISGNWGAFSAVFLHSGAQASFTYTTSGMNAIFTDTSTTSSGTIVAWTWDFGDSSSGSTTRNPTHTYASEGVYTVTLTVENSGGAIDTTQESVTIDVTAPSVPTGLSSSNVGTSSLDLGWNASTDNIGVAGYNVYQDGVLIAQGVAGTSYHVPGLTQNTTYVFNVQAVDRAGNTSAQSSDLSVTTDSSGCGAGTVNRAGSGSVTSATKDFSYALLPLIPTILLLFVWTVARRKKNNTKEVV